MIDTMVGLNEFLHLSELIGQLTDALTDVCSKDEKRQENLRASIREKHYNLS